MNQQFNNNYNFKTRIKDYFINISLDEEVISIVIYNVTLLDNIRYEIDLELDDMQNLSIIFNNVNIVGIYNMLIYLIKQGKLNLEKQFNDLILSFLIDDAGFQIQNNPLIQLILFGERDHNEYLFYLTDEIQKLRNQSDGLNNNSNTNNNTQNLNQFQIEQNNQNVQNIQNINQYAQMNQNNISQTIQNNPNVEMNSNDYFSKLNININNNTQELVISKKLLDERIITHLNQYELSRLTKLDLSYNKLIEIKGIENSRFFNLEEILLYNNNINNLAYLSRANIPKIKKIFLNGNEIKNLSDLTHANFPQLDILSLSKNEIADIYSLKNCNFPKLRVLLLDSNHISDISVFQYTNFKLEKLGLNDNKIVNLSVFEYGNFGELKELYLYNNLIENASPLGRANFEKLEYLAINRNKIKSINFLENPSLKKLRELYLYDNQFNDLSVFNKINLNLNKLYIYGNTFDINNNSGIIQSLKNKIKEFHYRKN